MTDDDTPTETAPLGGDVAPGAPVENPNEGRNA